MAKAKIIFISISLFFISVILGAPLIVLAQPSLPEIPIHSTADVVNIFNRILNFAYEIIGILSVIVILYSAALFLTAGDNEERRRKAAGYLKWGVVGIVVAILAGSIITLITSFLSGK